MTRGLLPYQSYSFHPRHEEEWLDHESSPHLGLSAMAAQATCNPLLELLSPYPTKLSPPTPPPASPRQYKRQRTICSEPAGGTGNQSSCPRFRDHVWTIKQKLVGVEELAEGGGVMPAAAAAEDGGGGMRLVQLLISCAEAVACRDRTQATVLLGELWGDALVLGTSFQRVASCFVQGLSDRLALLQPLGTVGVSAGPAAAAGLAGAFSLSPEREEGLQLAYELCPYLPFGHLVANNSIMEAFEGESLVHVVDLGMTLGLPHGQQWRKLLDSLAARAGPPPRRLRITGVGPSTRQLRTIGAGLESYARGLGINLEFSAVEGPLESLKPESFRVEEGEVVAVSSMLQLHCVVKESRGALNSVLQMIHVLSPKVLVLVEQDSSHNGPFFLGRFMEALHYYSAIFDSLDAALPKYDTRRAKVEQFYFAEEIKNIVSCEGPARVERHERVDQWRRRMSRAGFQPAPIKMITQAKHWLDKVTDCDGYTIAEEKGCLVLGWKSKPIIAASCWKCN